MDLNKRGLEQSVDATFEIKPKFSKLSKKHHLTLLYNLARLRCNNKDLRHGSVEVNDGNKGGKFN